MNKPTRIRRAARFVWWVLTLPVVGLLLLFLPWPRKAQDAEDQSQPEPRSGPRQDWSTVKTHAPEDSPVVSYANPFGSTAQVLALMAAPSGMVTTIADRTPEIFVPGDVLLNSRGEAGRVLSVSADTGVTWSNPWKPGDDHPNLWDACGSVLTRDLALGCIKQAWEALTSADECKFSGEQAVAFQSWWAMGILPATWDTVFGPIDIEVDRALPSDTVVFYCDGEEVGRIYNLATQEALTSADLAPALNVLEFGGYPMADKPIDRRAHSLAQKEEVTAGRLAEKAVEDAKQEIRITAQDIRRLFGNHA